jgi:L-serine dehydratase
MAAAAYAYVLGLDHDVMTYAAEIAMEHHLGLTCDPVGGYVIIPCIERNGAAVLRAIDAVLMAKSIFKIKKNSRSNSKKYACYSNGIWSNS